MVINDNRSVQSSFDPDPADLQLLRRRLLATAPNKSTLRAPALSTFLEDKICDTQTCRKSFTKLFRTIALVLIGIGNLPAAIPPSL